MGNLLGKFNIARAGEPQQKTHKHTWLHPSITGCIGQGAAKGLDKHNELNFTRAVEPSAHQGWKSMAQKSIHFETQTLEQLRILNNILNFD